MAQTRRKRKQNNTTPLLLGLISLLVVVLAVVLIVAISMGGQKPDNNNQTQPTEPTDPPVALVLTQPQLTNGGVVHDKELVITGTADPDQPLAVNGVQVPVAQDGTFTYTVTMQPGVNEIQVTYMGQTQVYKVEHQYAVQKFSPEGDKTYASGATMQISLIARQGSTIKVTFNGKSVNMAESKDQLGTGAAEGFVLYTGTCKMPGNNMEDLNLGKVTFEVTCDGVTETYTSGIITCAKMADVKDSDPSVTPNYGNYIDVGSGFIAEVISYTAETFNGKTRDDYSDPRNNYLPEGTLDYCDQDVVYDTSGKIAYRLLRCGRRVYVTKDNYPVNGKNPKEEVPVIDCYRGTLPDHNELGFVSMTQEGHFTVLTLNTLWKAPFYFDLAPQNYANPDKRDFAVTALTAEYIDITFCYATVFDGQVQLPENDPVFKSAELITREKDCTLRLHLKSKGGFYGWEAYYNDQDQLCFKFLRPTKAVAAGNAYGADLTGIRIMIDVGHGGIDGGASVTGSDGKLVKEADLNLKQAMALKKELESMGATVIMNRTDNKNITVDERIRFVKEQQPDICIAIHQNSYAALSSVNGCEIMYFGPTSEAASEHVYKELKGSGLFNKTKMKWYLYYVGRQTICPVVLVECGYMTNAADFLTMTDDAMVLRKAQAMAQGLANYFLNM